MKILYVCTGNIFRSMSAEYLTKKYLEDKAIQDLQVSSAGTIARFQDPFAMTVKKLQDYGCDPSHHLQRKITAELLAEQDLIICMAEHHKESVKALGFDALLFNELAYEKTEDLMDDTEYMQINGPDFDLDDFVASIVDYIHDGVPLIVEKILTI